MYCTLCQKMCCSCHLPVIYETKAGHNLLQRNKHFVVFIVFDVSILQGFLMKNKDIINLTV